MAQRWGRSLAAYSRQGLSGANLQKSLKITEIRKDLADLSKQLGVDIEKVERGFLDRLNQSVDAANREYAKNVDERARYWLKVSEQAAKEQERQARAQKKLLDQQAKLNEREQARQARLAAQLDSLNLTNLVRSLRQTEEFSESLRRTGDRVRVTIELQNGLLEAQERLRRINVDLAAAQAANDNDTVLALEKERVLVAQVETAYRRRLDATRRANQDVFTFDRGAFRSIDRGLLGLNRRSASRRNGRLVRHVHQLPRHRTNPGPHVHQAWVVRRLAAAEGA